MQTSRRFAGIVTAATLVAGLIGSGVAAASVYPEGRALHQPHKPPVVTVAKGSSWT